jgi:hypothetical protein
MDSIAEMAADLDHANAHVVNALVHARELRSTIHDGLTGRNDTFLKMSLLTDLDAIEHNLRSAL